MRILITGGAGFIGCNFVRYMLKRYPTEEIVVLDKLTYAGRLENLQDVMDTNLILKELNKPKSLIKFVKDRPGHDRGYSLDFSKIKKLGWKPKHDFETTMKITIKWYRENEWWWKPFVIAQNAYVIMSTCSGGETIL